MNATAAEKEQDVAMSAAAGTTIAVAAEDPRDQQAHGGLRDLLGQQGPVASRVRQVPPDPGDLKACLAP